MGDRSLASIARLPDDKAGPRRLSTMFMRYSMFACAIAAMLFCSQSLAGVTIGDCTEQKAKIPKGHLVLQSDEGNCVTIEIRVAKQSKTIANMVEDFGEEKDIQIPVHVINDKTLVAMANIMIEIFDKGAEVKAQIIKNQLPKEDPTQLLRIILAANYLDIGEALHIGVDLFAQKIFVTDLEKVKGWDENDYA